MLSWQQGKAQVLDNQGVFVTIRSRRPLTVGEEISISPKSHPWTKYIAAACVLLLVSGGLAFDNMALAHVSLDVKQSVELGVNWRDKVVSAKGAAAENQTPEAIAVLKGKSISDAVTSVVKSALKDSPESEQPMAVITVSGKVNVERLKEKAAQAVQQAMTKGEKVGHVVGVSVTPQIRAEAKEAGISPGQYALALKATEKGKEVTAKDIKDKGLEQALQSVGADPKAVAESAKTNGLGQVKQEIKDKVKGKATAPGQQKKK